MANLVSGKKYKLTLSKGSKEPRPERAEGDYSERVVKGKVRSFEQVERVYDEDGIAVGKTSETHWEIESDEGTIGFLPESVVSSKAI